MPSRGHQIDRWLLAFATSGFVAGLLGTAGLLVTGSPSARVTVLAGLYAGGSAVVTFTLIRLSPPDFRPVLTLAAAGGTGALTLLGALSFAVLFVPALLLWLVAGGLAWRAIRPPPALVLFGLVSGFGSVLVIASLVLLLSP